MNTRVLLFTLILAGCSSEPVRNETDVPIAAATASPVRQKATATPAGKELPARLIGRWAPAADRCGPAEELAMTIQPRRILFYESVADVEAVTLLPDGTIAVDAQVTGEGMTARHSFDLKLSADGNRLIRVEAPIPDVRYVRCPRDEDQR